MEVSEVELKRVEMKHVGGGDARVVGRRGVNAGRWDAPVPATSDVSVNASPYSRLRLPSLVFWSMVSSGATRSESARRHPLGTTRLMWMDRFASGDSLRDADSS